MAVRFGEFTLDTSTRRLLRDREEVHLSPKAFELLRVLIDQRSRAMAKGELQQLLWPSTYVLDTNLAGLIAEIRRGLGDPADAPRFIRTVPRFGYWFIGTVDDGTSDEDPSAPAKYWVVWETRQIALSDGDNILGRAPDAAVWIDAPDVSRHHAKIHLEGQIATLEDLGSKNGTYVRGERLTAPYPLIDGDQIRLGSVLVTFRIPGSIETTDTVQS